VRRLRLSTVGLALASGVVAGGCVSGEPVEVEKPSRAVQTAYLDEKAKPAAKLVSVHDLAGLIGLDPSWLEPDKKLRLASQWSELVFQVDSREVLLNGIRVFMGEGTVPGGKSLRFSSIDRDRLLVPILVPQKAGTRPPVQIVAIDPGHGGNDRGTRNEKLKLLEKDFTIDVARRLKSLLEARGITVVLTRENDSYVPLPERPARAATAGADVFVSLHFNSAASEEVRGIETYVLTPQFQRSTGSDEARVEDGIAVPGNRFDHWSSYLGYTVHRTLLEELKLPDRGLKRARFAVLRDLPCPGLLVEGGYLSNAEDAGLVSTEAYRDRLAAAVANGIDVYNQTLRRFQATSTAQAEVHESR